MVMKKILLLLVFTLAFVFANAQKVKVVENFEEDGAKYTRLSEKLFSFSLGFTSRVTSQSLFAFSKNDTTDYFIEIPVSTISKKGLTKENAIVKLSNDSIIELPLFKSDVIDLGTNIFSSTSYNRLLKQFDTYTSVVKQEKKIAVYYICQEHMSLMCDVGVQKIRFISKDGLKDLPSFKDCISEYYRKGVQMIKEAQSSYSKYKDL